MPWNHQYIFMKFRGTERKRKKMKKEKNEMDSDAKSIAMLIHASYQHVKTAEIFQKLFSKVIFYGWINLYALFK
jgi:hypothetical protein